MLQKTYEKYTKVNKCILIFLLLSFLGWTLETAYCFALSGKFCNRGFLNLPFCTIYGFSLMAIYILIGTPQSGGLMLGKCKNKALRFILYFLLAALIPTLAELATGIIFDKCFGVRLWNYSPYKYNYGGYICLEFSLIWGILITIFMATVFPAIERLVAKIPARVANVAVTILGLAICVDWIICFVGIGSNANFAKAALNSDSGISPRLNSTMKYKR